MKTCSKCSTEKDEDSFPWKNKERGVRSLWCRDCHNEYSRTHYTQNTDKYKKKARAHNAIYEEENKKYVIEYLTENPCVDCGESDLDVLEFDHIEMGNSKGNRVCELMRGSRKRLIEEINKCEVRFGNCHNRRTRKQMGTTRTPLFGRVANR